jgi:predicted DsbA family dithiol-disulfide isomerase
MAVFTPKVVAEVIEVQEFPDLGKAYQVRGVPLTVINELYRFTGAANEQVLVEHLKNALLKNLEGDS